MIECKHRAASAALNRCPKPRRAMSLTTLGAGLAIPGMVVGTPLFVTRGGASEGRGASDTFVLDRGGFDISIPAAGELTARDKVEIRNAVETLFDVKVEKVRTLIVRGRVRRMGRGWAKTQNWKKAMVHVKDGDTIDFFEGA